jgi:hypothetical protein
VQLDRLGQTYGEPERKRAGENSGDPVVAHACNIPRQTG